MEINYAEERCFKVRVTPELAQEWLNRNECNRNISQKAVDVYVRQMQEGKWVSNNDDICFSREGELLNGQHRLTAVVKSGIPISAWIKTGLEKSTHFDDGRGRTIRDQILATGKAGGKCPQCRNYVVKENRSGGGSIGYCSVIRANMEKVYGAPLQGVKARWPDVSLKDTCDNWEAFDV